MIKEKFFIFSIFNELIYVIFKNGKLNLEYVKKDLFYEYVETA